jgi:hypothetical protein
MIALSRENEIVGVTSGTLLRRRSEIYLISLIPPYWLKLPVWAKNSPSNVRLLLYCTAAIIKHGHAEKTIQIKWIAKIRGRDKRSNLSINK